MSRTSPAPARRSSLLARLLRVVFPEQLEEATEIAFPTQPAVAPALRFGWNPDLTATGLDEFVRTGHVQYFWVPAPVAERQAA